MTRTIAVPTINVEWVEKLRDWLRKADEAARDDEVTECPFPVWNQGEWRQPIEEWLSQVTYEPECGAAYCSAGWVSQESGGEWVNPFTSCVFAEPADFEFFGLTPEDATYDGDGLSVWKEGDDGRWSIHCSDRAQRILGLTHREAQDLFYAPTDLGEIERRLDLILAGHYRD